jgi:hypothetical protein
MRRVLHSPCAGFERARKIQIGAACLGEIGPCIGVVGIVTNGTFQQGDLFVQVAAREHEGAGEIAAQLRQCRIDGECAAIGCDCLAMSVCHLQRVADTEVRKSAMGIELGNNGGEFNRIVLTMLLEQRSNERLDRLIVEWVALCGGIEPLGLRFRGAVLPGCGGMPQESQES